MRPNRLIRLNINGVLSQNARVYHRNRVALRGIAPRGLTAIGAGSNAPWAPYPNLPLARQKVQLCFFVAQGLKPEAQHRATSTSDREEP
jgi:hypothetical protein